MRRWLILSTILLTWVRSAGAIPACTAADIIAQEGANCPASTGPCAISKTYDIASGTTCTFDFSGRAVAMTSSGRFNVPMATMILNAASFSMATTSLIDGTASGAMSRGGAVTINTSGDVSLAGIVGTRSRIDVSSTNLGGRITIIAGGNVSANGRLNADRLGNSRTGSGGQVVIIAQGNITAPAGAQSEFTAIGGDLSNTGGGSVELDAGGNLNLGANSLIDVSGSSGGTVDLFSGADLVFPGLRGNGTGESGSGATVTLFAARGIQMTGQMLLRGGDGDPEVGGEGGIVTFEALFGNIVLLDDIFAEASAPDGDGGEIEMIVNGSVQIGAAATLSVRSPGVFGYAGAIDIRVAKDLVAAPQAGDAINASGGGGGGTVDIEVRGAITLGGSVDASGNAAEGFGGDITITAGSDGTGALTVQREVRANGGTCSIDGCGDAGNTDLSGCDLIVAAPNGMILARAPGVGGQNVLTARRQLRIDGAVNATTTRAATGDNGSNVIFHPLDIAPIGTNRVVPSASLTARPFCGPSVEGPCLVPCPTCGNGTIEFPEQCDGGNAVNCDGCTSFCEIESCNPAELCPGGVSCDAQLGCALCPGVPTPTRTATSTASSTPTRTPTASVTPSPSSPPTATHTPPPSATVPATLTATVTPTAAATTPVPTSTATVTPTATTAAPTSTATVTPTLIVTASPSASASPTETVTATPTATESPAASPTVRACTGDCGGDGEVTVDELLTMVNIALGTSPASLCLAGDSSGDGEITIDEILVAVNNALVACP